MSFRTMKSFSVTQGYADDTTTDSADNGRWCAQLLHWTSLHVMGFLVYSQYPSHFVCNDSHSLTQYMILVRLFQISPTSLLVLYRFIQINSNRAHTDVSIWLPNHNDWLDSLGRLFSLSDNTHVFHPT